MENPINITTLNDFIFCPVSIYFHNLYAETNKELYQSSDQIDGTHAHKNIDEGNYKTAQKVLTGVHVYSERFNLIGKIDMYYPQSAKLVERKKNIKHIYDGYIFQVYGQYFAMTEMGYEIKQLVLHSIDDNKNYVVDLPQDNPEMYNKFCALLKDINEFEIFSFEQVNSQKCNRCIYEPLCDRSIKNDIAY